MAKDTGQSLNLCFFCILKLETGLNVCVRERNRDREKGYFKLYRSSFISHLIAWFHLVCANSGIQHYLSTTSLDEMNTKYIIHTLTHTHTLNTLMCIRFFNDTCKFLTEMANRPIGPKYAIELTIQTKEASSSNHRQKTHTHLDEKMQIKSEMQLVKSFIIGVKHMCWLICNGTSGVTCLQNLLLVSTHFCHWAKTCVSSESYCTVFAFFVPNLQFNTCGDEPNWIIRNILSLPLSHTRIYSKTHSEKQAFRAKKARIYK